MLGYSFGALGAVAVVGSFFLRLFESSIIPISLLTGGLGDDCRVPALPTGARSLSAALTKIGVVTGAGRGQCAV